VLTGHVVGSVIQTCSARRRHRRRAAHRLPAHATRSSGSRPIGLLVLLTFALTWLSVALGLAAKSVETGEQHADAADPAAVPRQRVRAHRLDAGPGCAGSPSTSRSPRSSRPCAGLLLGTRAADLADVRDLGIPVAEVVYQPVDDGLAGITLPNLQFGTMQAEHLIATGHTRIGFAYPADERLRRFAEPRLAGVREACRAAGLREPDVRTVAMDVDSAASAASAWTGAEPPITAVCAYNDETAIGLLAAARSLGVAVPTKLAVIGVDDIPTAVFADPPLTTVRADFADYADRLADLVVAATNGAPASVPVPTPTETVELIRRHSA
jgi:hypothetical protein